MNIHEKNLWLSCTYHDISYGKVKENENFKIVATLCKKPECRMKNVLKINCGVIRVWSDQVR